jgi:hypothetical protein
VGCQNAVVGSELGFYAARTYSVISPPRMGLRLIRSWVTFRVCVGSRASRRDLVHGDAGVGQHGVEGGGELAGPITDEEVELSVCSPRSMSGFLAR